MNIRKVVNDEVTRAKPVNIVINIYYDTILRALENNMNVDIIKLLYKELDEYKYKINGCDEGFKLIKKALRALENNYDNFIHNSNTLIENFILDIMNECEYDVVKSIQIKKILKFCQGEFGMSHNPKLKTLLDTLDKNISFLADK